MIPPMPRRKNPVSALSERILELDAERDKLNAQLEAVEGERLRYEAALKAIAEVWTEPVAERPVANKRVLLRDRIAQVLADNSAGLDFRSILSSLQADGPVNERSLQSSLSRFTSAGTLVRNGRRYLLPGKETEKEEDSDTSVSASFTQPGEPTAESVADGYDDTRRPPGPDAEDAADGAAYARNTGGTDTPV